MPKKLESLLENKTKLLLLILIITSGLLKLPDWMDGMHCFFGGDDHTYSLAAGKIMLGDLKYSSQHEYINYAIHRYGITYPMIFFYKIFGINDFAISIYHFTFSSLQILFIFLLIKGLFDEKFAIITCILLIILPINNYLAHHLYPDFNVTVYFSGTLWLIFTKDISRKRFLYSTLAGTLFALAFLSTTSSILLFPIILLCIFYRIGWLEPNDGKSQIREDGLVWNKLKGKKSMLFKLMFFDKLKKIGERLICFMIGFLILFIPLKTGEYNATGSFMSKQQSGGNIAVEKGYSLESIVATFYSSYKKATPGTSIFNDSFGILKQYLFGAKYYQNVAPFNFMLFSIGLFVFIYSLLLGNRFLYFKNLFFFIFLAFILYIEYEFISIIFQRKLFRYFLMLHLLVGIIGIIGIAIKVPKYAIERLLFFLFIFSIFRTLLYFLGINNYIITYLIIVIIAIFISHFHDKLLKNSFYIKNEIIQRSV